MKIYTKTGDTGTTGLVGGARVPKSDPRIQAYGDVDELNAALALAAVAVHPTLVPLVSAVQHELFTLGAHLATPDDSPHRAALPAIDPAWVTRLEAEIDAADAQLPALRQFILPGGTEGAARLHLARTVCRRAERACVALITQPSPLVVPYLNRLSDWLFTHARLQNRLSSVADVPWAAPNH